MDTCGTLNTGFLTLHIWIKSERFDLVAEFDSFDDSTPLEPIKLGGVIHNLSDFDGTNHGDITAIIYYFTPYVDTSGARVTISFALGTDVTVNAIFGLPMFCNIDSVIYLQSNSLCSCTLNRDFTIT